MSEKPIVLASAEETGLISRTLLAWLNDYSDLPVRSINFEFLGERSGLSLSAIQGAYKTAQYIGGGYRAEYQFKLIYRLIATTTDAKLKADEFLDRLADWAVNRKDLPDIGENRSVIKIKIDALSAMFANYEDGVEDHQVLMTLIYEVI